METGDLISHEIHWQIPTALQEKADPHEIWPVQVFQEGPCGELKKWSALSNDFSPEQIPTD